MIAIGIILCVLLTVFIVLFFTAHNSTNRKLDRIEKILFDILEE